MIAVAALIAPAANRLASAAPAWTQQFHVEAPASQDLRGFGKVATDFAGYRNGAQSASVQTFRCENAQKASVVIGKLLADITLSPKITSSTVSVGSKSIPTLTASGGAVFVGCVDGAIGRIVSAPSRTELAALLASRPALAQGAVAKAAYPMYLDRFDRYGWGMYGLDGYRNTHDWMGVASKLDGKKELKDPYEDFQWLLKNQTRFEPHLDPAMDLGNADGIIGNADDDWSMKLAVDNNLPVSFRLYGSVNSSYDGWLLRRFGEYQNRPADFITPHLGSYSVFGMQSWYAPDAHKYQALKAKEMVEKYNNQPNVMGWMHPYGEIQVGRWEYDHGDYSKYAQSSWRKYLQAKGCTLADVSRMYNRTPAFGDWEQVPVPEFATFAGLDGRVQSLDGQWWSRPEVTLDQKIDDAWWVKSETDRYEGLRDKWWAGPVDGTKWKLVKEPGGGGLPNKTTYTATTWFRRSFTLTQPQLAKSPVYLYWFPMSRSAIHSGARKRYHGVFINGENAGEIGEWGAIDATKYLKAGDNDIALQLTGDLWQGRIFLSTEEPKVFPALGDDKNKLWIHWRKWLLDIPTQDMATVLDGMRQADPNRPIKIMAPIHLGPTNYLSLSAKYGAFPHFTGEGMWYFPWYKRYSYLYDVPGSSETSAPATPDDPKCDDQFASFRRVFMAGLNAHDPVFWAQTYSRSPYLRQWWESHQPVLHQLGRYDLFGPQVLIFRSNLLETQLTPTSPYPEVGNSSRYVQSAWNWDIGRGTLQTLGQSYLYVDDQGVADGKLAGYKLLIDCGNEILDDAARTGIEDWVRNGGTYVTLPFTGRSSLTKIDSWPIRSLTGCEIGAIRTPGTGTVAIKANQTVFKACAGKVYADAGKTTDFQDNELNKYSVELKPGPDCEVLATYENGAPAVVRHRVGNGSVIAFGSAFWRNSQDIRGIWWPKAPETEVIGDMLAGLGQQALCETDGNLVWPQPYRSNNGLDWVTVLTSWNEDKSVASKLKLRLPTKPAALVSFGVDGEKELPFTWANGIAETTVAMPAKEVKVVRAVGAVAPFDAVSYWWNYQQRMWHELVKPTVDLEPYKHGQFADPAMDLRPDARFSSEAPASDAWKSPGFDDAKWTKSPLSLFRFWGAVPGKPLWVRKSFTVPADWKKRVGQIRMIVIVNYGPSVDSPAISLNGTPVGKIGTGFSDNHFDVDATKFLNEGENILTLEYPGKAPIQAVQGDAYLYFRATAERSIPIGTGTQSVFIPKEWEGKYRVTLYLEGERYNISGVSVNAHPFGRGRPYPAPAEYNLNAVLKYGEENTIYVNPGKKLGDVTVCRLDLFPIEE
jgi:hypothetical protein